MNVVERFDQQEMEARDDYALAVLMLEKIVEDARKLQGAARAAFLNDHRAMRDEVATFLAVYGSEEIAPRRFSPASKPVSNPLSRVTKVLRDDQFPSTQLPTRAAESAA